MPAATTLHDSITLLPLKPSALTVALCMVLLGVNHVAYAESVEPDQQAEVLAQNALPLPAIDFAIPAQRADEAIIAFANQAELTVVFPYNKVRHISANEVSGNYTPQLAIKKLLEGTGLSAHIVDNTRIKIVPIGERDKSNYLLGRLFDTVTAQGDSLVTVPDEQGNYNIEYIEVRGLRARIAQSVAIKRNASVIMDTIQSVDMGKFPDQNLAEALQRVSGVSIDRAEGEGQLVTVRGFGPEFNRVLLNGRPMATDKLGREFSFDTLASEIVSSVVVHKQSQASMQSGGIGATIDVQTAKPLSFKGMRAAGSVKMQYDTNSQQYAPSTSAMFSNTYLNNSLGVLASFTQHQRQARLEEAQIDGWLVNTNVPESELSKDVDTLYVPRNYDQRVRFDDRTRTGSALVLQYRPNNKLELTADYLGSTFDVETSATSMGHWFTSSNLEDVTVDENGTAVAFSQISGHATDFHARTFNRSSTSQSFGVSASYLASDSIIVDADLSYSKANVDDNNGEGNALSLIGYLNRSSFDHTQQNVLPAISGFEQANPGQVNAFGEPVGVSHYLDPSNGRAHVMLRRGWSIDDDIGQAKVNISVLGDDNWFSKIDVGAALTQREKANERRDNEADARHCSFCGYFDTPDIPDSFQTIFDAGDDFLGSISGHENIPHQWLRHDGSRLFTYLENTGGVSLAAETRGSSFAVKETVYAGYIQAAIEKDYAPWFIDIHVGLRAEYTDVQVSGVDEQLSALVILDQTELGQEFGASVNINESTNYTNLLPSLSLKASWLDNWVLRVAYNHSITRPTLEQMAPGVTYTTTRQGGDLRARIGNSQLLPFEAINTDFAIEHYYQENSYVSAGYFIKTVDNFIVNESNTQAFNNVTDPSTGDDPNAVDDADALALFTVISPNNGESATVEGVEIAMQHFFGESGWGLQANASFVDSNAELDAANVRSTFALTGLSGAKNVVLFYEKDALQWRVAWNQREGFLQSLNQTQSTEPTFVSPYQQWDMSLSYQISPRVAISFEGINITNETVHKRGRFSNHLLLVQDAGARYALGVNIIY
nr:TonB-dependent receptor [Alteromonas sp. KUL150]